MVGPESGMPEKVAPEYLKYSKGGCERRSYLLCDASLRGTKDGTQVRREESRGGRSQRGRGESPVRGGSGEPWLDRDADDRPSRQGAQGRGVFANRQEHARAQGGCRHFFRVHFSGVERTDRPGIFQR